MYIYGKHEAAKLDHIVRLAKAALKLLPCVSARAQVLWRGLAGRLEAGSLQSSGGLSAGR